MSPYYAAAVPLLNDGDAREPSQCGSSRPRASEGLRGVQPWSYDSRQNLVARTQSNSAVGRAQEDVQSDGVESESELIPPAFVYAKPRSSLLGYK